MPELGLNIDHVATLREARYRDWKRGLKPEPDVVEAARIAEQSGVDSITVHLREDHRHIQEADVKELVRILVIPLNLEMAATIAMTKQALRFKPEEVCLVPENREELTTEGGLDVASDVSRIKSVVTKLHSVKIEVSAFIDADLRQVDAAHRVGAQAVELHTGFYANAITSAARHKELSRHARAASHANEATSASTSRMCHTCTRSTSGTRLFPGPCSSGWSKPSATCWSYLGRARFRRTRTRHTDK